MSFPEIVVPWLTKIMRAGWRRGKTNIFLTYYHLSQPRPWPSMAQLLRFLFMYVFGHKQIRAREKGKPFEFLFSLQAIFSVSSPYKFNGVEIEFHMREIASKWFPFYLSKSLSNPPDISVFTHLVWIQHYCGQNIIWDILASCNASRFWSICFPYQEAKYSSNSKHIFPSF